MTQMPKIKSGDFVSNSGIFAAKSGSFAVKSGSFAAKSWSIGLYRAKSGKPMMKQHPQPWVELPIALELHQKLLAAACEGGFEKEEWELGAMAIREWLMRHSPNSFGMPVTSGVQWKDVFLPDGTLLRTVFDGKNHHCRVDGDQLLYEGEPTSPSRFANKVGGVRRNAWEVVWILLPNAPTWKRAGALRPAKR